MRRFWFPSRGDGAYNVPSITGRLQSIEVVSRPDGEVVDLVRIVEADGIDTYFYTFHSVLQRAWDAASPSIGDIVTITYHGLVTSKDGRQYHRYTVRKQQPEQPALLHV